MNTFLHSLKLTFIVGSIIILTYTLLLTGWIMMGESDDPLFMFVAVGLLSTLISSPAQLSLFIFFYTLKKDKPLRYHIHNLLYILVFWAIVYSLFSLYVILPIFSINNEDQVILQGVVICSFFLISFAIALQLSSKYLIAYCSPQDDDFTLKNISILSLLFKNKTTMESNQFNETTTTGQGSTLVKGLITGGLTLLLLIPTIFITNLIQERELRQREVVNEVSARWAKPQTIAAPYIIVPYHEFFADHEGKILKYEHQLVLFSKNLQVNGNIIPENRSRSIYKILLYRSQLNIKGTFLPQWPADIKPENIDFANAKLCFGIGDFKGVEKEISIRFNNKDVVLAPGLPVNVFNQSGLSAPIAFTQTDIEAGINFNMEVGLKGSGKLHFLPISSNSTFNLKSTWPNPSFDGNNLPNDRSVSKEGFTASWNFNQANLPFNSVTKSDQLKLGDVAFGVSMVQPADQYDKTSRSVKYAILIIGLTFAVFFIMELLSNKPFHPMQYVLVGLALVIFYTLLLSISEYILFDIAYAISAAATILLVTLYAKSHFGNWKAAAIFSSTLTILYGFIFVLLRLEDTALLIGSIGLFIVLAIVMYLSRKISWYTHK